MGKGEQNKQTKKKKPFQYLPNRTASLSKRRFLLLNQTREEREKNDNDNKKLLRK